MNSITSVLKLKTIVFDKIEFHRKGFKNSIDPKFTISVQIGKNKTDGYKVTLTIEADKEKEYELSISLSGLFSIENDNSLTDDIKQDVSLFQRSVPPFTNRVPGRITRRLS